MVFLLLGFSTGIISLDKDYTVHNTIDKLNETVNFTQTPEFKKEEWGWSGSLFLVEDNLAWNIKMLKGKETKNLVSVYIDLSFDSKLIELGYSNKFSRFIFFLTGGGGYSTVNLKSVRENEIIYFDESLWNPEGNVSYNGSSFVLSASAGLFLAFSEYLACGISGGYVHSLRTPEMVLEGMEDIEIQNSPQMPLHQWYVKFSFGVGDFKNL